MKSHLEVAFLRYWDNFKTCAYPHLTEEHKFLEDRKFRFDFALPDIKVGIEIEGGLYAKGRHTSVIGYNKDCEKYNLATLNGWRVLRFTEKMLDQDPMGCIEQVKQLIDLQKFVGHVASSAKAV